MNEILYDELLDNGTEAQKKRPVFLLVLCILTFVGAGIGLIGAVISLLTMGQAEEAFNQMNNVMGELGGELGMNLEDTYKWAKISNYLNLLGNALCLGGALLMFRLRKFGFYIYVPGQIFPLIGAYLALNSMFGGGILAGLGVFSVVFNAFIAIAFIVMYGLNLKHMK